MPELTEKAVITEFLVKTMGFMLFRYGPNFALNIVEAVKRELNAAVGALFLLHKDNKTLTLYADDGYLNETFGDKASRLIRQKVEYILKDDDTPNEIEREGLTAYVARTRKPILVNSWKELKKHPAWAGKWDDLLWDGKPEENFKSLIAVPLNKNGKCIGVLKVENRRDENNQHINFTEEDRRELLILSEVLAKAIDESGIDESALVEEAIYPDINRILIDAVKLAEEKYGVKGIKRHLAVNAWVRNSIEPKKLIDNLAEVFRISREDVEEILACHGFSDLVAFANADITEEVGTLGITTSFKIKETKTPYPYGDFFEVIFKHPDLDEEININTAQQIRNVLKNVLDTISKDPFLDLYRKNILEYFKSYNENISPQIHRYIKSNFGDNKLKYLVNSGIGANEQFSHFVASLNNKDPNRKITWLICDCPKELKKLPKDINKDNTLFIEFSRSGKTEETVKIHEFTDRDLKRIVFANSGPLKEIGERDKNLVLPLPDEISGRYGRNKTPILLGPMDIVGLNTKAYWEYVDDAIDNFDFNKNNSLAVDIATYIYCMQAINNINHIYLGTNNEFLLKSADEMVQFWNEGTNKNQNDISLSRYFGLPRDSHLNIEGILANAKTKMGIFLIYSSRDNLEELHPLINRRIDPINSQHEGLQFGDEDIVLALANFQHFSQIMPTILIDVKKIDYETSAILGQLWADITYVYSRLKNIDPGSNPEVKYVRDRSSELLAKRAKDIRNGLVN